MRLGLRVGAAAAAVPVSAAIAVTGVDLARKRRDPRQADVPPDAPRTTELPPSTSPVAGAPGRVTTYTYGAHLYDAMLADIEAATDHVYLASYIWKSDEVGQRFKDAVIAAARRGVTVCVVFDGFANLVVPPAFQRFPPEVHVLRFPTVRGGFLVNVRRSGRDHRKILVVDDTVAYCGGYNIGSVYATQWRDTHVRVEGPAVWELANVFVDFWNRHRNSTFGQPELPDSGAPDWGVGVRAIRNEPSRLVYPVRYTYLEAIDRATERVWITQGYFIPDKEIKEALVRAAGRGVDVRVILPAVSNHVVADWVARSYFSELLAGGVRLHRYTRAMVHAKTATVDGQWSTVGTANIDRLSLLGNYEVNLVLHDQGQARAMEEIFRRDLEGTVELTWEAWEQRPTLGRVGEAVLRPLQTFL